MLTVNTQKSAVGRPWERSFLGFTFSRRGLKVKVSDKALVKLKATVKQLSRRTRGHSIIQIIAELSKIVVNPRPIGRGYKTGMRRAFRLSVFT